MAEAAIRILLVEDNPGDARLIRAYLGEADGTAAIELEHLPTLGQALQRLQDGPLDLLLLDLMLPDGAGLDTFREAHRHRPDLPIIVMTGLDVDELAIRAVQEGAQDYLVKDHLEPGLLGRSIRYAFERAQRQRAEKSLRERDSELRIARKVQDGLHPVAPPRIKGYDIAGASISTEIVGGDYYDFIPMPEDCLGIAVGDASGHGLGPALLAAEARATVRTLALTSATVAEILTRANQVLSEGMPDEYFITLLFARLNPFSGSFVYSSAGHCPGFILNGSGEIKAVLDSTGFPLGLGARADFAGGDATMLEPGDVVLLLTDGIREAGVGGPGMFGDDRALEIVKTHRHESAARIVRLLEEDVRSHCGANSPGDDLTIVVVKVDESARLSSFSRRASDAEKDASSDVISSPPA